MKLKVCLTLFVALLSIAGCREDTSRSADPGASLPAPEPQAADANTTEVEAFAPRIYYDLTRHDWYRRGEPLVVEGREYLPAGDLVVGPLEAFDRFGDFEGVDYYGRREGSDDVLFVPVFERYWLPFAAEGIRRAD